MTAEVLIADDSEFVRNLLRQTLGGSHDVVDEGENGVIPTTLIIGPTPIGGIGDQRRGHS